jgi:asparagine synthase (glutamine-hydrolysing)
VFNSSHPLQICHFLMPGIAGIIGAAPAAERQAAVDLMVQCLRHEPFYHSGNTAHESLALAAGWVCHPGSFGDCLPIWNQARSICLLFSGEHFADTSSDATAESLVRLYEQHGTKFFGMLNGTFHGLVVDLRENKAVLFNDRYGLARLYYHENAEVFYFAAEAKSLLKVVSGLRRLDLRSFGEFFSCGCALQNRTLFQGVSLLPGGAMWTFQPGQPPKKESYFHRQSWENPAPIPPEAYYERLKETFHQIVPRYLKGNLPVALSLTGGLDSRMVIAEAFRSLPCYTFGGMYRQSADVKVGRRVAAAARQNHEILPVDSGFFPEFARLADQAVYFSDGAMDVTGAVELFANRRARQIASVRLTGNYGSEVLRGNVAFRADCTPDAMLEGEFAATVRQAAQTYEAERKDALLSFIAFKQVPWHHYARMSVESTQLIIRSPFLDNDLVSLAYQAPADLPTNKALSLRLIAERKPDLAGLPTDRGSSRRPGWVPEPAWHWCQEFLPRAEYVYDYGMPHWLARVDRVLSPLRLERLFLGRQKFYHFRTWYRHELSAHVKAVLLDPRTLSRPYLDAGRVEQLVQAHTSGTGNYTKEIHKLLTTESLQRQLIEQP